MTTQLMHAKSEEQVSPILELKLDDPVSIEIDLERDSDQEDLP